MRDLPLSAAVAGLPQRQHAPRFEARLDEAQSDPARLPWREYEQVAERLCQRFAGMYVLCSFDYQQPLRLQKNASPRLRKPYAAQVAYTAWGPADAPVVICCGGVANSAMRFSFLAADLHRQHRVICMDWLGRGLSGWLADDSEYTLQTYVEQLRQMVMHLGGRPVAIVGSSMGGTVAMELAARHPELVTRLVLNDVGPSIPQARRKRRAETLSRFYVFRSPHDMLRRVGASQKNDGPLPDDIRLFVGYHQTRWSPENGGRVYRHDIRALMTYKQEARASVTQWSSWARIGCPVLLIHGMESDALAAPTIARMRRGKPLTVAHVPQTGHTPALADRNQTHAILAWLQDESPAPTEFSIPLAAPRRVWHR